MEEQKQNKSDLDERSLDEAIDLLHQMKKVDRGTGIVRLRKDIGRKSRRSAIVVRLKVAAVVLPLCIGGLLWWQMRKDIPVVESPVKVAIVPGAPKAYLILERGNKLCWIRWEWIGGLRQRTE